MFFDHCSVVIVARRDRLVGLQEEGGATQGAADHAQGASATQRDMFNGGWMVNECMITMDTMVN